MDTAFSSNVSDDGSTVFNLGAEAEGEAVEDRLAVIDIDVATVQPLRSQSALVDRGIADGVATV